MKDFIIEYYEKMRTYLREADSEDAEVEALASEVDQLKDEYFDITDEILVPTEPEDEEQNAVWGLFTKFDRLHGTDSQFVKRDAESLLAKKLDLGFGLFNPPCPFSEEDFPDIQKKITTFISQRVKTPEDDGSMPLLTGVTQIKLSQEQLDYIIDNFICISHSFTDYVDSYDDGFWDWLIDCHFIVQYVFEKAAELTYKVTQGETSYELEYDIREAFSYFQLLVPDSFQMRIDCVVDKIDNIVSDITTFIEKNDYHLCDKETWFRPILFNVALDGMFFSLEQKI